MVKPDYTRRDTPTNSALCEFIRTTVANTQLD